MKQYALTLKTETVIRRKISIAAKLDQTTIIEADVDEVPGTCTLAFVLNNSKILNQILDEKGKVPQLSFMWRYRSFNLLLNQQNELHLFSIEMSLLDSDDPNQPVIKYTSQVGNSPSALRKIQNGNNGSTSLVLVRNQWHRFEGKLVRD